MGTQVQALRLDEADYRGARFADSQVDLKGCMTSCASRNPHAVRAIHRSYLEAGADIIETNTFNAYCDLAGRVRARSVAADQPRGCPARARRGRPAERADGRPRFVAGVLGPTSRTASLSPDV